MKKIFRLILPCLALGLAFASCQESLIDDKADIDAKYEATRQTAPTISLSTTPTSVDYQSIGAVLSLSDTTNVEECGVMYSTTNDFASYSVATGTKALSSSITISKLTELTTYYVRGYVVTKDGATVVGSDIMTATTTKTPIFDLVGDYTAGDYTYDSDNDAFTSPTENYTVNIAFEEGSTTNVLITNLWGGGETLVGEWNEEDQTITIPSGQVVYVHASYGDAAIYGVNDDISGYTDSIVLQFTKIGGTLRTSYYQVSVSAGSFGIYYTTMSHN